MYGWSRGALESLVVVVVHRDLCAIFEDPVIFRINVLHLDVTGNLTYQSRRSDIIGCILPDAIRLVIPYLTNGPSNEPAICRIILLVALLVVIVINVVDPVVVQRETDSCIPCEIFVSNVV